MTLKQITCQYKATMDLMPWKCIIFGTTKVIISLLQNDHLLINYSICSYMSNIKLRNMCKAKMLNYKATPLEKIPDGIPDLRVYQPCLIDILI